MGESGMGSTKEVVTMFVTENMSKALDEAAKQYIKEKMKAGKVYAITEEEFTELVKDMFSDRANTQQPRYINIGTGFCEEYMLNNGNHALYEFLSTYHVMCGYDEMQFIKSFIKDYEKEYNVINK